jgi:isoamylase
MMKSMDTQIDCYPTHEYQGYKFRKGRTLPFGASVVPNGVNFSIYSSSATACSFVLFRNGQLEPEVEIKFPTDFRVGDVYSMIIFDLDLEDMEYGYRFDGPADTAAGHRFDWSKIICDPYARAISGRDQWGEPPDWSNVYPYRARLAFNDFDWENDCPLERPLTQLVIYEMHVRGFTSHPSSGSSAPGTFAGMREKIPYLKELGINCVELLPIFEFDEYDNSRRHPESGASLLNYWGYSPVGFFAPKAGYAATGKMSMQIEELKALIKALHAEGIEVILDVVFNHTAEGDHRGPTISFKGIDNRTFYLLTAKGDYHNFSGCGNSLNANHPVVVNLILDCIRYWVSEYHIDGFRFDEASALCRGQNGAPLANPPLLEALSHDPVLSKCKLIAEAWDAGGLNQVGSFPHYGRWAEWNGNYRDCVRSFLRGDTHQVARIAQCILGSPDLYYHRGPSASINFVTCHDGFTLRDLVSYNHKHNDINGENNLDGSDANYSSNFGHEGPTTDMAIEALRLRVIKNAFCILLLSRGVPMILMGDELGRTQNGNNNAYCHDDPENWMDWALLEPYSELFRFASKMIRFRTEHTVLQGSSYFRQEDWAGSGKPDIGFHGTMMFAADFSEYSRCLAFLICGAHSEPQDVDIYVAMNMHWEPLLFELPTNNASEQWKVVINTSMLAPADFVDEADAVPLIANEITVGARSIMVLVASRNKI